MTTRNSAIVRRAVDEVLNRHNPYALPEFVVADVRDGFTLPGQAPGLAGLAGRLTVALSAFPDLEYTIDELVEQGDRVALRGTLRATHTGPLLDCPPTGRTIEIGGMSLLRLAGGRIIERWGLYDLAGLLRQIGPGAAVGSCAAHDPERGVRA